MKIKNMMIFLLSINLAGCTAPMFKRGDCIMTSYDRMHHLSPLLITEVTSKFYRVAYRDSKNRWIHVDYFSQVPITEQKLYEKVSCKLEIDYE